MVPASATHCSDPSALSPPCTTQATALCACCRFLLALVEIALALVVGSQRRLVDCQRAGLAVCGLAVAWVAVRGVGQSCIAWVYSTSDPESARKLAFTVKSLIPLEHIFDEHKQQYSVDDDYWVETHGDGYGTYFSYDNETSSSA